MTLQVGVKALIRNSQQQYLFLRRSAPLSTDKDEPSWDIPGGRIQADESLIDALRREVREEIGYNISGEPQLLRAQDIFVPAKELHVVRLTYVLEEDATEIQLSGEHDAYEWVDEANVAAVSAEPYLAEVLKTLS